jgi:hypothetical protein
MNNELKTLKNDGEMLNEQKFQKVRKKIKIVAICFDVIGVMLLIAGIICAIVISAPDMGSSGWFEAEGSRMGLIFGLCVPGGFLLFLSIPLWLTYHQRSIAAFQAQQMAPVTEEGADKVAGPVIQKAAPHIGNMIKEVSKGWNDGKSSKDSDSDFESKLDQIERLKTAGKISEEEYNQMRKKILGL